MIQLIFNFRCSKKGYSNGLFSAYLFIYVTLYAILINDKNKLKSAITK